MDKQQSVVDVLNLALEREKEAFEYYREKAESAEDPNLRSLFYIFASDEQRHASKIQFELLKIGKTVPVDEVIPMMDDFEFSLEVPPEKEKVYLEIFETAIEKEDRSFKTYASLLKFVDDPDSIEILVELIEEEVKHKLLLELKYKQLLNQ